MPTRPWIKFYPADWQADQALGMCSLAARGLWLEMLAIMHRADPYGHLLVNGKVPTDTQLAALARCPLDQIPSLLDELESAGVFSKGRNRVIYSRRLTRDEKHRKDGETAQKLEDKVPGSRRWQVREKQRQNTPPPRVVAEVVSIPPSDSEARYQKEEGRDSESLPENPSPTKNAASRRNGAYAFCGKLVRLNQENYNQWRKAYHGIADLDAALTTLDDYYDGRLEGQERRNWFIRCSKALEKEHQKALAARQEPRRQFTVGVG